MWILFVFVLNFGATSGEFTTKQQCLKAAQTICGPYIKNNNGDECQTFCVWSGE